MDNRDGHDALVEEYERKLAGLEQARDWERRQYLTLLLQAAAQNGKRQEKSDRESQTMRSAAREIKKSVRLMLQIARSLPAERKENRGDSCGRAAFPAKNSGADHPGQTENSGGCLGSFGSESDE